MKLTKVRAFKASGLVALGGLEPIALGEAGAQTAANSVRPAAGVGASRSDDASVESDAGTWSGSFDGVTVLDSSRLVGGDHASALPDVDEKTPVVLRPVAGAEGEAVLVPEGVETASDLRTAAAGVGVQAAASSLCWGTWYRPRGGSLVPGDPKRIYFKPTSAPGFELRRLAGMECFGDNQNFQFPKADGFKDSGWVTDYGRRVVHKDKWIFEGCKEVWVSPSNSYSYLCDFKASESFRLNTQQSGAFWRQRLRNWATQTVTVQGQCATTIVGLWVQTNDLNDVAVDCIDNGPINPNGL